MGMIHRTLLLIVFINSLLILHNVVYLLTLQSAMQPLFTPIPSYRLINPLSHSILLYYTSDGRHFTSIDIHQYTWYAYSLFTLC